MAQLLYQGHGSYRIMTQTGVVIYVDPFAGSGYDVPADLILVTHEHIDHNSVSKVPKKENCRIIRAADALQGGIYHVFEYGDVKIEAVEAYNRNHSKDKCVGFILTVDDKTIYAAGDTSETEQMKEMKSRGLDWALLPIDGIFNMDPVEASHCAELIGAAHTIPIHAKPGGLFDQKKAEAFKAPGRVIVKPGETVDL